jgi:hypothetical protein
VLLAVSSFAVILECFENQRLQAENAGLKQGLTDTSEKLQESESRSQILQRQLNGTQRELNETRSKVAELQNQVTQLQEQGQNMSSQIEKLREQLKLRDYITIGLTFLWSTEMDWAEPYFHNVLLSYMNPLNHEWDPLHIFFFIRAAQPESFVPSSGDICALRWVDQATRLYPGPDIPIAIYETGSSSEWAGCEKDGGIAIVFTSNPLEYTVLAHELLHVFGFTDVVLQHEPIYSIPSLWYAQILSAAQQYEMPLPADYEFP